jgi:hypothetical protein
MTPVCVGVVTPVISEERCSSAKNAAIQRLGAAGLRTHAVTSAIVNHRPQVALRHF